MRRAKSKRKLTIVLSIILVLVIALAVFFIAKGLNTKSNDPYIKTNDTSQPSGDNTSSGSSDKTGSDNTANKDEEMVKEQPASNPELDPASVGSIDIEPMKLVVSYVKGVGGFDYQVLRTPDGTSYVEFSNEGLIGTKCTNDKGAFASIVTSPEGGESATVSKTVKVGDSSYGLSLSEANCTGDADLLGSYQKSFSDAFYLLKKLD